MRRGQRVSSPVSSRRFDVRRGIWCLSCRLAQKRTPTPPPSARTLPLFDAGTRSPTLAQAWAIVKLIPLRARFMREMRMGCGPYWFADWIDDDGRRHHKYVGSDDKKEGAELAHARIRRELEKAELALGPGLQRLRALEAKAGVLVESPRRRAVRLARARRRRDADREPEQGDVGT